MHVHSWTAIFVLIVSIITAAAEENTTNTPPNNVPITVQEMLQTGPSAMKLHSLSMMLQGTLKGEIDATYLPGLESCAADPSAPIRATTARVLGICYIEGQHTPNDEALTLLLKLTKDDSVDVRYSAIYYGLTNLETKSDDVLGLLLSVAANTREPGLYEKIHDSLKSDIDRVTTFLNKRLEDDNAIAYYEIYEDFTGKKVLDPEKFLEMPSSKPRLFIVAFSGEDVAIQRRVLIEMLEKHGYAAPNVRASGFGGNYVFMVKTQLTKEYLAVETVLAKDDSFTATQDIWLTPELEVQFESIISASEATE